MNFGKLLQVVSRLGVIRVLGNLYYPELLQFEDFLSDTKHDFPEVGIQGEKLLLQLLGNEVYLLLHDDLVPHFESLPLPELPEEVEGLDPIEGRPFLQPVVQRLKLLRGIRHIQT